MKIPLVENIKDRLGKVGFTGERRALALFLLSMFSGYFLLLMLVVRTELPEWFPAFTAMFALYLTTFFGVAAGWFWGRWVAIGLGSWGVTIAVWGMITVREISPPLLILGASHGLIALLLMGDSMAALYEGSLAWRARLGLDEDGVKQLRKTVTRGASSVPAIVLFALAPRQEGGAALLACAVIGLGALLVGRTVALLPLAGAALGAFAYVAIGSHASLDTHGMLALPAGAHPELLALYAGLALSLALAPFAGPIGRYLRRG